MLHGSISTPSQLVEREASNRKGLGLGVVLNVCLNDHPCLKLRHADGVGEEGAHRRPQVGRLDAVTGPSARTI